MSGFASALNQPAQGVPVAQGSPVGFAGALNQPAQQQGVPFAQGTPMPAAGFAGSLNQPMQGGVPVAEGTPMVSSGFAGSLNEPMQNIPIAQGYPVTPPDAPPPGVPTLGGFELWVPPKPNVYQDGLPVYEILGTDAQIVQFPLRAGRQIMCFSGAMAYMSDGMKMDVKLAGLMKTFGRLAGGGSLFQITYTNESGTDGYIAMTPDYPGVIIPVNMRSCQSGKVIAMRDSFLCATVGLGEETTDVSAGFNPANSVGGFCCSGVDFIVQTVSNGEWAFLMGCGTILQKMLQPGEKILVDTDSVLCFESSVSIDIQWVGSTAACCCGGEGLFNTTMTGPGRIWIQSLSIDKLRRLFPPNVRESNSGDADAGSAFS